MARTGGIAAPGTASWMTPTSRKALQHRQQPHPLPRHQLRHVIDGAIHPDGDRRLRERGRGRGHPGGVHAADDPRQVPQRNDALQGTLLVADRRKSDQQAPHRVRHLEQGVAARDPVRVAGQYLPRDTDGRPVHTGRRRVRGTAGRARTETRCRGWTVARSIVMQCLPREMCSWNE